MSVSDDAADRARPMVDLAEEALHDAFRAALEQWPRDGAPSGQPSHA